MTVETKVHKTVYDSNIWLLQNCQVLKKKSMAGCEVEVWQVYRTVLLSFKT